MAAAGPPSPIARSAPRPRGAASRTLHRMRVMIMAAGLGTRLRPLTLHTPKPIVPIFDRPFLRYQIDLLKQVPDIDEIVRLVRFPGWQDTLAGEREIKKALRKALFKYKLHADEELFEKAYSYIRQYY